MFCIDTLSWWAGMSAGERPIFIAAVIACFLFAFLIGFSVFKERA